MTGKRNQTIAALAFQRRRAKRTVNANRQQVYVLKEDKMNKQWNPMTLVALVLALILLALAGCGLIDAPEPTMAPAPTEAPLAPTAKPEPTLPPTPEPTTEPKCGDLEVKNFQNVADIERATGVSGWTALHEDSTRPNEITGWHLEVVNRRVCIPAWTIGLVASAAGGNPTWMAGPLEVLTPSMTLYQGVAADLCRAKEASDAAGIEANLPEGVVCPPTGPAMSKK